MKNLTGLLTGLVLFWNAALAATALHVRVLDVGEGQSVLLHSDQRAILVDTGHAGVATKVLSRLQELGIEQLDYLVLTHLHPDHASGYFRIHEQFPQATVVEHCRPLPANLRIDMIRWVHAALQRNENRLCVTSGDRIDWKDTQISVLWPPATLADTKNLNHGSLVIQVSRGQRSLLIMGDADKHAEAQLLASASLQPVDLLVVGHHGADDASSAGFLQIVRPRQSVISIDKNNIRGYPSPRTLQRLGQLGGDLHLTYIDGEFHLAIE